MNSSSNIITRSSGREHGKVYTNRTAIEFILNEVDFIAERNLEHVSILEPAAGSGAFAMEIINRLYLSSETYGFPFLKALSANVRFVEINDDTFISLVNNVSRLIEKYVDKSNTVSEDICIHTNFLKYDFNKKFDCIVGNPPYIRHELIDILDKTLFKKEYRSFTHRADMYVLFYEKSLSLLNLNGLLTFICSNRWLNNQYGATLREIIAREYHLVKLCNIEKSSPFDEDVIAYPCITTISNSKGHTGTLFVEDSSKRINFADLKYREVSSPIDSSWQNIFLEYDINNVALCAITDLGYNIGIGVATGADKIFIGDIDHFKDIEPERLIPILKSDDLKKNVFRWSGNFVINPFEDGTLCDLEKYPKLKKYLERHRTQLLNRHVAKKNPEKWYKTIDKINHELQQQPKLLLPDLTGNKVLFIDEGKFYPHHNLYYITAKNGIADLKLLGSILMSEFVREQMTQIGIRMNGGLPRFQAQVLKKMRIPNIDLISYEQKIELIKGYDNKDMLTINKIIDNYCKLNSI